MKRTLLVATLVLAGCGKGPTAPSAPPLTPVPPVQQPPVEATEPMRLALPPLHHNIPFSVVGHEETILWLCSTQPRTNYTATGETVIERDHYAQHEPCPAEPIE